MTNVQRNAGLTVGMLIEQLGVFDSDAELYMGGLEFYRLKQREPKLVQLEFHQNVYRDKSGKLIAEDAE